MCLDIANLKSADHKLLHFKWNKQTTSTPTSVDKQFLSMVKMVFSKPQFHTNNMQSNLNWGKNSEAIHFPRLSYSHSNIKPVATSNVSDQMTVIFCEHKNNSGGVLQIFTLDFHMSLLLMYF
jgi:hypothetical protein